MLGDQDLISGLIAAYGPVWGVGPRSTDDNKCRHPRPVAIDALIGSVLAATAPHQRPGLGTHAATC